ncbi:MAG: hypothetical protein RBQ64_06925 [Candidatus Izemoplasmatales bacterium]|nr:hypothetical protein [Candidatus Izemoplasmatales bacterium]
MKFGAIIKIYGKLKMKCFEMPNASYTVRWQQGKENQDMLTIIQLNTDLKMKNLK